MKDFVFVHVTRTGGTSVTSALRPFGKDFSFHDHIGVEGIVRKIGGRLYDSLFSFAFVRNPWCKQVSFYTYIRRDPGHHLHTMMMKFNTFEDYIRTLPEQDVCLRTQQLDTISFDGIPRVDFIGRFEYIERDFETITERIGVVAVLPPTKFELHRSRQAKYYRQYYTKETKEIVARVFARDIRIFDYEF